MPAVPRVGEFLKFRDAVVGDYFAFQVSSVTYREDGHVEVWTELLDNIDNRMYSVSIGGWGPRGRHRRTVPNKALDRQEGNDRR